MAVETGSPTSAAAAGASAGLAASTGAAALAGGADEATSASGVTGMEVIYARCAGLDVHKETVVACVRIADGGEVCRTARTFGTTTASLIELWRVAGHACGDGTVWQVLSDGDLELILANAAQVKNVPGRKTDVNDASWLSELLAHGLVRASFVPGPEMQKLREPRAATAEDVGGSQHQAGVGSI
jgi:hypothetical protein